LGGDFAGKTEGGKKNDVHLGQEKSKKKGGQGENYRESARKTKEKRRKKKARNIKSIIERKNQEEGGRRKENAQNAYTKPETQTKKKEEKMERTTRPKETKIRVWGKSRTKKGLSEKKNKPGRNQMDPQVEALKKGGKYNGKPKKKPQLQHKRKDAQKKKRQTKGP